MSTTPLTLPTLEELLEAFPMATDATQRAEGAEMFVRFGKKKSALIYIPANAPDCFACTLQFGRYLVRTYHKAGWQQCVDSARARVRASMVKEAEEAQAAVAALDQAMSTDKETGNG